MRILAIETSCDETAIAIADFAGSKKKPSVKVLSNIISSQVKLHAKFGGVVPNLAKREHQRNLVPILLQALREAELLQRANSKSQRERELFAISHLQFAKILEREQDSFERIVEYILPLKPPKIDAIAVTYGPGLAPALWVGVNFAKALAYIWNKPLIPVNHMAGHLYSAILQSREFRTKNLELSSVHLPALALLVSGGHTELVLMKGHGKFKVIGETLDDAAGEAFDKVARILGLKYPGGPEISRQAEKSRNKKSYEVEPHKISLPRPMINSNDYNFSFSGLKTAVLYMTRDLGKAKTIKFRAEIAKEFQDAVVEVLVKKTVRAAKKYKVKTILLGGGVAANKLLRQKLTETARRELAHVICLLSLVANAGDNALMIALAAYLAGNKKPWTSVRADANLRI